MTFAAIFPGQGSQSTGMLADLASSFNEVGQTFDEGSTVIGKDLWQLVTREDNVKQLNQTKNTQPVMLAAGVAVWRVWLSQGGCLPSAMAGHSLGEYSALVASKVIGFGDAMSLVAERARLMQQAVPDGEGAMAAILGLDDAVIVEICETVSASENSIVEAANFNAPGQVVIAGNTQAVDTAINLLSDAGAKRAIKLPVSVPSHCSLMKGAAMQLKEKLISSHFLKGICPVLHNVSVSAYDDAAQIQLALAEQLYKPVRWVETINALEREQGADTLIEFGPGKVLSGLNRRINRKRGNLFIQDSASLEKALEICNQNISDQ